MHVIASLSPKASRGGVVWTRNLGYIAEDQVRHSADTSILLLMPLGHFLSTTLPRLSFSRHDAPRHPHDVKGTSLPDEVLLEIFSVLADNVLNTTRLFHYRLSLGMVPLNDPTHPLKACISALLNASLVSRSWCSVCTEFLYSNPVLTSPKQFRLFSRTLEQAPHLSFRVRTLFIADIRTEIFFPLNFIRQQESDPGRICSHLSSIFRSCASADRIFVNLQYPLSKIVADVVGECESRRNR